MTTLVMAIPDEGSINKPVTAIVQEYGKRLYRFIRSRVSSDADAEDILQDVWYQFSRVVGFAPIEQLSGWLFRVARNRLTDQFRRTKNRSLEDFSYENEEGEQLFLHLNLFEDGTPETELFKKTVWETLFAALDELPEDQRNVFIWNELEDETFQSIADRTGENIKTLISRKRYAVAKLRERLAGLYHEIENQ